VKEVLLAACSYEARKYGIHSAMPNAGGHEIMSTRDCVAEAGASIVNIQGS